MPRTNLVTFPHLALPAEREEIDRLQRILYDDRRRLKEFLTRRDLPAAAIEELRYRIVILDMLFRYDVAAYADVRDRIISVRMAMDDRLLRDAFLLLQQPHD